MIYDQILSKYNAADKARYHILSAYFIQTAMPRQISSLYIYMYIQCTYAHMHIYIHTHIHTDLCEPVHICGTGAWWVQCLLIVANQP